MFLTFDHIFHVYLMRGFQIYERNWILTMVFWVTCKIAQPIQPIWQQIFALPWSALKKPPWEFNFLHIFGISSSSRQEKCGQMLETLFWLFQCSKNPWCLTSLTYQCTDGKIPNRWNEFVNSEGDCKFCDTFQKDNNLFLEALKLSLLFFYRR